jgi:hypothetical protein
LSYAANIINSAYYMKTATNFINESSRQDFEQFVIDNKELSIKMTQKPWAYTVHKFNEVFEKTPWRIGRDSTLPVIVEDMAYHTAAVRRGNQHALIMTDLPFMSYATLNDALQSSKVVMQAGAQMVKVEGGADHMSVTLKGNPVEVRGEFPAVGAVAAEFSLPAGQLQRLGRVARPVAEAHPLHLPGDGKVPPHRAFRQNRRGAVLLFQKIKHTHLSFFSVLTLSVTCGDSSPKGRAKSLTVKFLASPFGRGGFAKQRRRGRGN